MCTTVMVSDLLGAPEPLTVRETFPIRQGAPMIQA
jgi:hypothetical protein